MLTGRQKALLRPLITVSLESISNARHNLNRRVQDRVVNNCRFITVQLLPFCLTCLKSDSVGSHPVDVEAQSAQECRVGDFGPPAHP
jgi:hypothetical protein